MSSKHKVRGSKMYQRYWGVINWIKWFSKVTLRAFEGIDWLVIDWWSTHCSEVPPSCTCDRQHARLQKCQQRTHGSRYSVKHNSMAAWSSSFISKQTFPAPLSNYCRVVPYGCLLCSANCFQQIKLVKSARGFFRIAEGRRLWHLGGGRLRGEDGCSSLKQERQQKTQLVSS